MNNKTNLIINVVYEEFQPDTYKGIEVSDYKESEIMTINTGNFNFDWDIVGVFIKEFIKENPTVEFNVSSSVDNYIADVENVKIESVKKIQQDEKLSKLIAESGVKLSFDNLNSTIGSRVIPPITPDVSKFIFKK